MENNYVILKYIFGFFNNDCFNTFFFLDLLDFWFKFSMTFVYILIYIKL